MRSAPRRGSMPHSRDLANRGRLVYSSKRTVKSAPSVAPLFWVAALGLYGCGTGDLCTPKDINAELIKQAPKGGVVHVGECTVNGAIDVPAGVTLRGASVDRSIISGDFGHPAVTVHADLGSTQL